MYPIFYTPDFWLKALSAPDRLLFSTEDIQRLNQAVMHRSDTACTDLFSFPMQVTGEQVSSLIKGLWNVWEGLSLSSPIGKILLENCALPHPEALLPVQPCVLIEPASLRAFPSLLTSFSLTRQEEAFDFLSQTTAKIWEPALMLHQSQDERWLFVCTHSSMGWVERQSAAFCHREDWCQPHRSLLVTGDRLFSDFSFPMTMGTRLPLHDQCSQEGCYSVLLPTRDACGWLKPVPAFIPYHSDTVFGVLPLTYANLFRQLFKLAGHPYRWSGLWDCSALVQDVFSSFGLILPRNTGQQTAVPCKTWQLTGSTPRQKKELIFSLPPGSLLYMSGHVMILLGQKEGEPMVLHALWECRSPKKKLLHFGCTAVTGLNLYRVTGESFYEGLTVAKLLWEP